MLMPDGVWRVATQGATGDTLLIGLQVSSTMVVMVVMVVADKDGDGDTNCLFLLLKYCWCYRWPGVAWVTV